MELVSKSPSKIINFKCKQEYEYISENECLKIQDVISNKIDQILFKRIHKYQKSKSYQDFF